MSALMISTNDSTNNLRELSDVWIWLFEIYAICYDTWFHLPILQLPA